MAEAEHRGHTIRIVNQRTDRHGYEHAESEDHFIVTAQGHPCGVRITQLKERTDHVASAKELADAARDSWVRIPRFDHPLGNRLGIAVGAASSTGSYSGQTPIPSRSKASFRRSCRRSTYAEPPRKPNATRTRKPPANVVGNGKPPYTEHARTTPRHTGSEPLNSRNTPGAAPRSSPSTCTQPNNDWRPPTTPPNVKPPSHGSAGSRGTWSAWTRSTAKCAPPPSRIPGPRTSNPSSTAGVPTAPEMSTGRASSPRPYPHCQPRTCSPKPVRPVGSSPSFRCSEGIS